jgi:hypothetical protein
VISLRYVPAVCALLALALIPTIIHSYSRLPDVGDGRVTTAIPMVLADYQATPSARNRTWGKRRFDSDDWTERVYADRTGRDSLRLTVIRSFDAKALYHHPELAITYPQASFVGEEVRRFDQRPDIPVHVLKPGPGEGGAAFYALHYGTGFVDNPIAFQIRTAGELLFSRRKPMTLFFVFDRNADQANAGSSALTLLFSGIDTFLASRPGSREQSN